MIENVKQAILTGKLKKIEGIVQETLDEGVSAGDILNAMIATMDDVGDKFQRNEIFVPEMLVAALTMKKGVAVLKPLLAGGETQSYGKYIIGTVEGDLHDIGKNLVALMVESAGFEVIDLGVDVPAAKFVEAIKENPDCKVVGISALLTTIPYCVLGGATLSVFASITMTGMKLIASEGLSYRNTSIVGLAVAMGVGITLVPQALALFPAWVTTVFGKSPVVLATLVSILLNLTLPGRNSNKKQQSADQQA